jgi:hypothetical protein
VRFDALRAELRRDDSHWPAAPPPNPTPPEVVDAWCRDAEAVHQAAHRVTARRRTELIAHHEQRLAELREAA